jgi:putative flippase GtrA
MLRLSEGRRMVKYALVGGLNTSVDFAVFCMMVYGLGMGSIWAQVLSYGAGLTNSYLMNRKWTFQAAGRYRASELVRFILINMLSFGTATTVLLVLEQWGMAAAGAKIVSVGFSLIVNYVGYRLWVFVATENKGEQTN